MWSCCYAGVVESVDRSHSVKNEGVDSRRKVGEKSAKGRRKVSKIRSNLTEEGDFKLTICSPHRLETDFRTMTAFADLCVNS